MKILFQNDEIAGAQLMMIVPNTSAKLGRSQFILAPKAPATHVVIVTLYPFQSGSFPKKTLIR